MNLYHPVKIGEFEAAGNLFLAPAAGWTDMAFRYVCAERGASLTYTELISAEALVRGTMKHDYLLRNAGAPRFPYAIQLFGAKPETLAAAARLLAPYKPAVLDLNAGCPVPKVTKTGAGSALMKTPALLAGAVAALKQASCEALGDIPVTVKLRSGWDAANINYMECALLAQEAGAALITLHPRTRAQGYGGVSDWSKIAALKAALDVPAAGSGDLRTPEDAARMMAETGCDAVMFARGAMGNPFIFRETREFLETGSYAAASLPEKIAAALEQLEMAASAIGEKSACMEMRKAFCAYTKGFSCGAELRRGIIQACTIEDYRRIFAASVF
ncbi:MAG: tRNA dihydrouridine synthase DusB [Spirochaetaceae bacterium]|jgi:nifR3 family TIM-barrel protein|nr:tRNA dihydrouridine synthase DusB [Spirochaetaceae bacterium]